MRRAHVVGGGLAGLAAALALADCGWSVTVYEAGPACGGRCRSYFDRDLGCRIDNGNHLLLSGNHAAQAYLAKLGTLGTLAGPGQPVFPFLDLQSGERWTVRPNLGRLPWWVLAPGRRVPGARLGEFLGLRALHRAAETATVREVLVPQHRRAADADPVPGALYRRLLEPLAIAALNTPPEAASARLLAAVVAETLAEGGRAYVPAFPGSGLSESFIDPAVARLERQGSAVQIGRRIGGLTIAAGRVTGLGTAEGPVSVAADDAVVLATPAPVAAALMPGLVTPDQHEAIVNLHYRATLSLGPAGFLGVIGGLTQWVFAKTDIVSVTISAANRIVDRPAEILAAEVWREIGLAFGTGEALPPWRVVKEKRATFAATPAQQARRPATRTHIANLVLAGDWTDTGLPATIEGAIRSGQAAADCLHPTR